VIERKPQYVKYLNDKVSELATWVKQVDIILCVFRYGEVMRPYKPPSVPDRFGAKFVEWVNTPGNLLIINVFVLLFNVFVMLVIRIS
jgi:hypothetical protein